jgi:hypothetical protein
LRFVNLALLLHVNRIVTLMFYLSAAAHSFTAKFSLSHNS